MNARTGATPDAAAATAPTYDFTFGVHNQTTPWTDVRALPWHAVVDLLRRHCVGPKAGSCVAPAVFSGGRRGKDTARRIDVAFLDSDAGATLREIRAAIAERGWAAVVSSTHSHLSTSTRAKRTHWARFRAAWPGQDAAADQDLAVAFLRREKGYLPRIAEGARLVEETDEFVVFEHTPCPKFRIAVPLLRPWRAEDYGDQRAANAAWKEAVEGLAAALRLDHDQSCTDTSRVFYLPRRPPDGPAPEWAVLDGAPCDIFALPRAGRDVPSGDAARRAWREPGTRQAEGGDFVDPGTGEVFDLVAWARRSGPRRSKSKKRCGPAGRTSSSARPRTGSSTTSAA